MPNINCRKKTITILPNDEFSIQIGFQFILPIPNECYIFISSVSFSTTFWVENIGVFGSQSTTESIIIRNMLNLSNKSDLKRFYNWKFNHFPDVFWSTSSLNYNEKKITKTIKRILKKIIARTRWEFNFHSVFCQLILHSEDAKKNRQFRLPLLVFYFKKSLKNPIKIVHWIWKFLLVHQKDRMTDIDQLTKNYFRIFKKRVRCISHWNRCDMLCFWKKIFLWNIKKYHVISCIFYLSNVNNSN